MWPISPAAPRPVQSLPSITTPPPTPVPQKTPRSEPNSLPAPSSNSAWVATETSLPSATGTSSASDSTEASGNGSIQLGRFRACATVPACASISPGEPTPTPLSAVGSSPAASQASRIAAASSFATSSGPPLVGVGRRDSPSTRPSGATTAAWILVPPRSSPPRTFMACATLPRTG